MKRLVVVLLAVAVSLFGVSAAASAHDNPGGGKGHHGKGKGHYPVRKPTVSTGSAEVGPNQWFVVTAKNFCPDTPIRISLSNASNTYAKWSTTHPSGSVSVRFNSRNIQPGTYTITGRQTTADCQLVARSSVRVRSNNGNLVAGSTDIGGLAGDLAALTAGMEANAAAAATASQIRGGSVGIGGEILGPTAGSTDVSALQLMLVALTCALGLGTVTTIRRRTVRPLTT